MKTVAKERAAIISLAIQRLIDLRMSVLQKQHPRAKFSRIRISFEMYEFLSRLSLDELLSELSRVMADALAAGLSVSSDLCESITQIVCLSQFGSANVTIQQRQR